MKAVVALINALLLTTANAVALPVDEHRDLKQRAENDVDARRRTTDYYQYIQTDKGGNPITSKRDEVEVVDVVLDDVVPDDAELGDGNPANAEAREPANDVDAARGQGYYDGPAYYW
ncbi:hypothetical protein VFPFJ_09735 [Purpureocillium lilacinum]|uniref:Uncharacterized protein n=1 Tax=Purpureocillium lilacinum TaxID=33203 RepID=A0A179GVD5_PURLI|nr:hypothetical protein VFPFJ_09735 [Purpureocillium lilacinum]KAK4084107.1 hypothetical protein Purlil1_10451 [Purpureocillium lilacinum]OAQ81280.1 hypothetical protein VFPFJ_09735 [Purpureocillium lilacinum]